MTDKINYSARLLEEQFEDRASIRRLICRTAHQHLTPGSQILELGSGLGDNLASLSDTFEVLGVEGLDAVAAEASGRGIRTIRANLEGRVPLDDCSFDAALCLDVLEHLVDPIHCIREAHRLLRVGGLYVVNVPNHFTLTGRIRILMGHGIDAPRFFPTYDEWNYPHLRFFRHQSILKAVTSEGFSVVADLSREFPAVPMLYKMKLLRPICSALGAMAPNAFCGGFFIVFRKNALPEATSRQ